jgi:DNA/RNA endonuclease G (NUC1)
LRQKSLHYISSAFHCTVLQHIIILFRAYTKKSQAAVVKKLLGTDNKLSNGTTIIDISSRGQNYFAKGHLSPDAAFIDEAEQDATYFYINVAPQFQSFNNGNWKSLEYAARDMAEA